MLILRTYSIIFATAMTLMLLPRARVSVSMSWIRTSKSQTTEASNHSATLTAGKVMLIYINRAHTEACIHVPNCFKLLLWGALLIVIEVTKQAQPQINMCAVLLAPGISLPPWLHP